MRGRASVQVCLLFVAAAAAASAAARADEVRAAGFLPAGTILARRDLVVDDTGARALDALIGRQLVRAIPPGRAIIVADVKAPDVVLRNQLVTVIYADGGLEISAEGRALSAAAPGETVRVVNTGSRRTVEARAVAEGIVEVGR